MKQDQSKNMHLLCFDNINYPKSSGVMRMIEYGGGGEPYEIENCTVYNSDGSVTLKYYNPTIKKAEVRYRKHNYKFSSPEFRKDKDFYSKDFINEEMELGDDGYWRITINPGVGFHSIYFIADGIKVINTRGSYGYDGFDIRNFVDIPDDSDTEIHDVPHGTIHRDFYKSSVTGRYRACWIYLPASYFVSDKHYPVLYIQHGGSQDEVCWFQSGKLDLILDNLIAKGQAEEMIVVCNNGYVFNELSDGRFEDGRLDDVIIKDCIPHIESRYRVLNDRLNRAAAGLSMGGGHARRLAFGHPDVFANVGIFSSGECFPIVTKDMDFSNLFSNAEQFNNEMRVVFIACGDADPRFDKTSEEVQSLQEKGFNIEFKGYKGQHEWNVWRYCGKDFVKRIFRKEG